MFNALDDMHMAPEIGANGQVRAVCPGCYSPELDPDTKAIPTYAKWLTINGQDPDAVLCGRDCDPRSVLALIRDHAPSSGEPHSKRGSGQPLIATPLSAIPPRSVHWLLDGRVPLGELTLLAGPEGVGKSTFLAWLAAGVTRGTLPGHLAGKPGAVLIAALEDDGATTLVPRMTAAGADLGLIASVGDEDGLLALPAQIAELEALVRDGVGEVPVRLLILDPIKATTGGMDTDRERGVRPLLGGLAALAQGHGVTTVAATHFKKGAGAEEFAAWKVSGSPAWTQVPRSVLYFGMDPDAEDDGPERIIAHAKCNVGRAMPTLMATITTATITGENGEDIVTSVMTLGGESKVRASEMSSPREAGGKVPECGEWLRSYLGDGERHDSRTVKEAGKVEGFADRTISRAVKEAGVKVRREGSGASHCSYWSLPAAGTSGESGESQAPPDGTPATDATPATHSGVNGTGAVVCTCPMPLPAPTLDGEIRCAACGLRATWSGVAA